MMNDDYYDDGYQQGTGSNMGRWVVFVVALVIGVLGIYGITLSVPLEYVYLYPDKVSSLVLIDSLGLGREVHFLFKLLSIPVIGELILRPSRSGSKKSLGVAVYDQSLVTDELVDMAYRLACIPGTAKCLLSFIRTGSSIFGIDKEFIRPIIEKLPTVEAPTLIIWGEQDRLFPVEHASVALKNIPDAQLEVFERCGHIPHLEHPDKFNSLVLKFLEK